MFNWTHSTGALWWKVTYAHRQAYVSQAPDDNAMNLFFHQFRQLPRSHVDTANIIYMVQFVVHQVTPDDGSAVYFLNRAGQRMAAPGQDPIPTSYYFGDSNAIVMRSVGQNAGTGTAQPDTGRIGPGWANWTDRSPMAANTPGVDPLSGGNPAALSMFQNHATHEVGHAVGNRTLSTPGINAKPDEWTRGYATWRQDGSASGYARMLGFTAAMDSTRYTVSHDGGTTTSTLDGDKIRDFLTTSAQGGDVSRNKLVRDLGSAANAFAGLAAHAVLGANMLVRTVGELNARFNGRMPDNNYFFPFGVPAGPTRVTFFCSRWGNQWVTYDRGAFDNKTSHYAVSSYKEMFAEMYTAKYSGGAVPPAIGSNNPSTLFNALDNADPADFGMAAPTTSPGADGSPSAAPTGADTGGDGWDQGPGNPQPWP
ncbi:MAG: hypothetical protein R3F60_33150 [bacterium]